MSATSPPSAHDAAGCVHAHAKLTRTLRVVGVRADGYHLIDAEMVALDLCDDLRFAAPAVPGEASVAIEVEPPATEGLAVTAGDDNLVLRALRHVGRGATVSLTKRIPAGAGLGGGSADAAAVLRWAGHGDPEAARGAAALGADVPFCVRGGRARVTGIGELLEPLPFVALTFTLAFAPFGVSTPAVYRAWDALGGPRGEHGNDLEPAALAVEPRLGAVRDRLHAATGVRPVLAGSGSSWFVPGAFPAAGTVVHTVPAA